MARKYIYKRAEMERRRAFFWTHHYELRAMVKGNSFDNDRILRVIMDCVPAPCMDGDGALIEGSLTISGKHAALDRLHLLLTLDNLDLMCAWFWSESNWMEYVRLYQALPEVTGDYYLAYDAERYAGLLLPVDNSGESAGKVADFPQNARRKAVRVVP